MESFRSLHTKTHQAVDTTVVQGDCLAVLTKHLEQDVDLVYIDPPLLYTETTQTQNKR